MSIQPPSLLRVEEQDVPPAPSPSTGGEGRARGALVVAATEGQARPAP